MHGTLNLHASFHVNLFKKLTDTFIYLEVIITVFTISQITLRLFIYEAQRGYLP